MNTLLEEKTYGTRYMALFFIGLVLANFSLKTLYPHPAIWMTSTIFFILFSFVFFINKSDISYFIIFLIIGTHFSLAPNQGGLFNLLAVTGLSYKLFVRNGGNVSSTLRVPSIIKLLILVLFTTNFLSTLFNSTGSTAQQLFGILSFLSCILVFLFSMYAFKDKSLLLFLKMIILLSVFNFVVAINQRFFGIFLNTSLFPLVIQTEGYVSTAPSGTIGSSALFGEFYLLVYTLLVYIKYLGPEKSGLRPRLLNIGIIFSLFNLVLSSSRSAIILAIISSVVLFLMIVVKKKSGSTLINYLVILVIIVTIGSALGLFNVVEERISNVDIKEVTFYGLFSGEDINRGIIFDYAKKRLNENSWLLGQGYGVFETNANTWFGRFGFSFYGKGQEIYDIHSLYLGLPMLFGWFGAISYIAIIFYILLKLISSLKYQDEQSYGITMGLIVLWIIFLINEYKVNATALPHYHFMIWALLGLSCGKAYILANEDDHEPKD